MDLNGCDSSIWHGEAFAGRQCSTCGSYRVSPGLTWHGLCGVFRVPPAAQT